MRTRVLELAVHGLDLATALERQPWMTPLAATVTEDLLLPSAAAARRDQGTVPGWRDYLQGVARNVTFQ